MPPNPAPTELGPVPSEAGVGGRRRGPGGTPASLDASLLPQAPPGRRGIPFSAPIWTRMSPAWVLAPQAGGQGGGFCSDPACPLPPSSGQL